MHPVAVGSGRESRRRPLKKQDTMRAAVKATARHIGAALVTLALALGGRTHPAIDVVRRISHR
jgi:hypothetical protein